MGMRFCGNRGFVGRDWSLTDPPFKRPTDMKSIFELVAGLLPKSISTELVSGSGKSRYLPSP